MNNVVLRQTNLCQYIPRSAVNSASDSRTKVFQGISSQVIFLDSMAVLTGDVKGVISSETTRWSPVHWTKQQHARCMVISCSELYFQHYLGKRFTPFVVH